MAICELETLNYLECFLLTQSKCKTYETNTNIEEEDECDSI